VLEHYIRQKEHFEASIKPIDEELNICSEKLLAAQAAAEDCMRLLEESGLDRFD